jgi:hypothetical protein
MYAEATAGLDVSKLECYQSPATLTCAGTKHLRPAGMEVDEPCACYPGCRGGHEMPTMIDRSRYHLGAALCAGSPTRREGYTDDHCLPPPNGLPTASEEETVRIGQCFLAGKVGLAHCSPILKSRGPKFWVWGCCTGDRNLEGKRRVCIGLGLTCASQRSIVKATYDAMVQQRRQGGLGLMTLMRLLL